MNLKLKKLTIATAAAVALGAAGQAQSADLLFPYVVTSPSVTTIVSVLNPVNVGDNNPATLHYRLWYKNGPNATDNLAVCDEVNVFRSTSPNDIQTIDLGDNVANTLGVMFNDPSINNNWQAPGQTFALAGGLTQPVRGYLVIDDQTAVGDPGPTAGVTLQGEAFVFEFQSGAAWGYQAGAGASTAADATDFTNAANGVVYNGTLPVSVMPWDQATTRFFITPLVADMRAGNNSQGGNEARVRATFGETGGTAMWDRDENPVSGNVNREVRCVGAVDASQLISEGARNFLPDGGWGFLNTQGRQVVGGVNTANPNVAAAVIKLEFNDGSTSFAGASTGVFNNAFLLR